MLNQFSMHLLDHVRTYISYNKDVYLIYMYETCSLIEG